jgi:hypothetical protein
MKRNDAGDFTVLYVEPGDQRTDLFQTVGIQKKPVVIIQAAQAGVLQKPDDFTLLKYVKRQADVPIIFILPHGSQQAQLAARNGFPVYQSMDALLDALSVGQVAHMRPSRPSRPLDTSNITNVPYLPRSTKPLFPDEDSDGRQGQVGDGRQGQQWDGRQGQAQPLQYGRVPEADERLMGDTRQGQQWDERQGQAQPLQYGRVPEADECPTAVGSEVPEKFTPIPQFFLPEEEAEQEELYSDPYRTLVPNRKDDREHNAGKIWPSTHVNISYRNTRPLAPGTAEPGPAPQTPPIGQAPAQGRVGAWQGTVEVGQRQALPLRPLALSLGRDKPRLYILLCVLVIAALSSLLVLPHFLIGAAATPQVDGHLIFTSSGQVSETSSQGIEDQVTLDLTNLVAPATGKALYAWLLGDKSQSDLQTVLLGKLQINNGTAHLFYAGNAQHTNLLLTMSRVLVTEEDTTFAPVAPSPDQNTWRYYNEFSTVPINTPDNTKHFSTLDHLRHLLASDPTLEELELHGGLNNWLYNNTNKTKEWVDSTRQQWEETKDTDFVRRQLERTLQFLDGDTFVYQDVPQGAPLLVNERLARLGLINIAGPNQEPPDYLTHISHHLNGLLEANPTPATRQKITALITAMGNVNQWLKQVRYDAQQLMNMTDTQMMQDSTLTVINDMIANMDNAYSGQPDPSTNTVHEGVNWIHTQMQFLASLEIVRWNGTSISPTSTYNAPSSNNSDWSQPRVLIAEDKSKK